MSTIAASIKSLFINMARKKGLLGSNSKGIVFLAPHPSKSIGADGFQQRVLAIDKSFNHMQRWYVTASLARGDSNSITEHQDNSFSILITPLDFSLIIAVIGLILKCKILYIHSVYGASRGIDTIFLFVPNVFKIFDMHGIVPEELKYDERKFAIRASFIEFICARSTDCIITVTNAMLVHVRKKYRNLNCYFVILPIYDESRSHCHADHKSLPMFPTELMNMPGIIYAGGYQPWQLLPLMVRTIKKHESIARYLILVPDGFHNYSSALAQLNVSKSIIQGSVTPNQVKEYYKFFHYGFILRDDSIVNKVSCPTKLIEYLCFGIIPIMISDNIGDFSDLRIKYLPLERLDRGELLSPDELTSFVKNNFIVYERVKAIQASGLKRLSTLICKVQENCANC